MALRLLGCLLALTSQGDPPALSSGQASRDNYSAVSFRLGAGCGENYRGNNARGQIITVPIEIVPHFCVRGACQGSALTFFPLRGREADAHSSSH